MRASRRHGEKGLAIAFIDGGTADMAGESCYAWGGLDTGVASPRAVEAV